jgi:hypothetical protein
MASWNDLVSISFRRNSHRFDIVSTSHFSLAMGSGPLPDLVPAPSHNHHHLSAYVYDPFGTVTQKLKTNPQWQLIRFPARPGRAHLMLT